jgi:hypothetical protein
MSDSWINRLVVAGPVKDVQKFARVAMAFVPPDFGICSRKPVKAALCFESLYKLLPASGRKRVSYIEQEPEDLTCERLVMSNNGTGHKEYKFMLSCYEPDSLFIEVSRIFPFLCFVLGWVAYHVDEAASKFIRHGKVRRFDLPDRRCRQIWAIKNKEWGEDSYEADTEADWAMLDAVVSHWDKTLANVLKTHRRRKVLHKT